MQTRKSVFCRALQILLVTCTLYFFYATVLEKAREASWSDAVSDFVRRSLSDGVFGHIGNRTLGFEHIYAIGLEERTDKRDFMALTTAVSGITVQWMDGVRPDELHEKSLPQGYNLTLMKPAAVGCWRAHMNALNDMLSNGYSTALILEDDADWDVTLRAQLQEFAVGLHALKGTRKISKEAPYGVDWDVLWIGGCASGPNSSETDFYAIPNDPTVPRTEHRGTWGGPLEQWKEQYPEYPEDSTRFVYRSAMGCCTYGYAVSKRGAQNVLMQLSVDHIEGAIDNAMSDLCGFHPNRTRIECYAPFPNLVGTYRRAGSAARDSDINVLDWDQVHGEEAWNLIYSTRMNIHRLVAGERTVYSQWDEDVPWSDREMNLDEFVYPRGHLVRG
ncbi:hypothetical protein P168DRAFT_233190 [Aspergillus campestris IBT 28561]|uniref:Glycosyl transferase family 25 domain-containing protein n=1 Tax=Aspergillus campestris (strain IBT 28561) TaxID=1392248 RepID=A0A2I1D7Z8_ASPC2|nr:uncharacterized protein P168DRAFT_233190 [Aspergillus campestris IBT 28561]PKY06004.1 hypothetical protein P168DRAFT_233190 [Aspergillus campestris IBT 28561]